MEILKRKSSAANGKQLYACLMMDEMSIRKQLEWSQHKDNRFIGYIDFGTLIPEPETLPLAKDVLVYLLNGISMRDGNFQSLIF